MSKIWFTSDLHLGHKNICKGTTEWTSGYRDFPYPELMNDHIINQLNKYVGQDDTLYFLGDFCFGGHNNTPIYRSRIICRTIHVCVGNHDKNLWRYRDEFHNFYSDQNVIEELRLEKQTFFLSHYPHLSWLGSAKGHIHLHGHEHGAINHLNENCRRLDVGIDSAYKMFGEYRPFSLEEVIKINLKKPISELGHHTKNTNVR